MNKLLETVFQKSRQILRVPCVAWQRLCLVVWEKNYVHPRCKHPFLDPLTSITWRLTKH
jgi:hypothetical protein